MGELIEINFSRGILIPTPSNERVEKVKESLEKINTLMNEIKNRPKILSYEVFSYSVWGDEREGYEVNDCYKTGDVLELKEGFSDRELLKELKLCGVINKKCHFKSFEIEGEQEYSLYINYTNQKTSLYPICELRIIEEGE